MVVARGNRQTLPKEAGVFGDRCQNDRCRDAPDRTAVARPARCGPPGTARLRGRATCPFPAFNRVCRSVTPIASPPRAGCRRHVVVRHAFVASSSSSATFARPRARPAQCSSGAGPRR